MSAQDDRKLLSIIRSIEIIEEQTNQLHTQYVTAENDKNQQGPRPVDDSNIDLVLFFQQLEQLLELDLKNRSFLLNSRDKRTYWNFFSLALKESKGLYDTVLYVNNRREVKTSVGRGRLFLRFCLQNHRLGDVIQQSFMMQKIVNQFYGDDCFWTNPTYMNRIIHALYQLNELQYNLLSRSQTKQLDTSWPTIQTHPLPSNNIADDSSRIRNESETSLLSMNSVDAQSYVSILPENSIPIDITPFENTELSADGGSSTSSFIDENNIENSVDFWKQKFFELETQIQNIQKNDMETQCTEVEFVDKELTNRLNHENEELKRKINFLQENNDNLENKNVQLNEEKNKLKDKKDSFENEMKDLSKTIHQMNIEITELNQQNEQLKNEISVLTVNNGKLENINTELNEKNDELSREINALNGTIEKLENKTTQLNEQNAKLYQQSNTLSDKNDSLEQEINDLNKTVQQFDANIIQLNQNNEELKTETIQSYERIQKLESEINSLTEENDKLMTQVNILNDRKDALENQTKDLTSTIERLSTETLQSNQKNEQLKNEISSLMENNDKLNMEINTLNDKRNSLENEINKLSETNARLNSDVNQLHEKNGRLCTEINLSNENNDKLNTQVNALNDEKLCLQNQANDLNKTIEQLNIGIMELTKNNDQLKSDINMLKEEINKLNVLLSNNSMECSKMSDQIKNYEHDIAQYQTLIQSKDNLLEELQENYDKQALKLQSLEAQYSNRSNEQNKRCEFLEMELDRSNKLIDKERDEMKRKQDELEVALNEKTLAFEEMKRHLLKAAHEKSQLANSVHNYELKLEEEQSKKWVPDEEVANCLKCTASFGWTVRRHHCRKCQKIFCHQCSNNWLPSSKPNSPQNRICDFCYEKIMKDTPENEQTKSVFYYTNSTKEDSGNHSEVQIERLLSTNANKNSKS